MPPAPAKCVLRVTNIKRLERLVVDSHDHFIEETRRARCNVNVTVVDRVERAGK